MDRSLFGLFLSQPLGKINSEADALYAESVFARRTVAGTSTAAITDHKAVNLSVRFATEKEDSDGRTTTAAATMTTATANAASTALTTSTCQFVPATTDTPVRSCTTVPTATAVAAVTARARRDRPQVEGRR